MLSRRAFLSLAALAAGCRRVSPVSYKTYNIVGTGNSILAGNHVTPGVDDILTLVVAALSLDVTHVHNIAVPSSSIDNAGQGATADGLYDGTRQVNICLAEFGANDGASESAATFFGNLKTYGLARIATGFLFVPVTVLPLGSYNNAAFRHSVRSMILADPSFYSAVIDVGDTTTTMGADSAYLDSTLYQAADLTHPTSHGNTLLEPYYSAAIRSLITNVVPASSVFAGVVR